MRAFFKGLVTALMVSSHLAAQDFGAQDYQTLMDDRTLCLLPQLPLAHANNAVASYSGPRETLVFSFMGLMAGKSRDDVSRHAYMLRVGESGWTQLPDVPVAQGRLAATAQVVGGKVYVFGGYSVAADGSEKSEPEVHVFDPQTGAWAARAPIPLPVDDTVSFVYADRYVYLVSGWHDVGNQNRVQLYDTETDQWADKVTDFPGKAVFGHAGGIVDDRFVILDGVAVTGVEEGRRTFGLWPQAWEGRIDPADPAEITWIRLPAFERPPLYRAAAIGDPARGRILFAGGSSTAYNYTGIGYTGEPATPLADVVAWNIAAERWERLPDLELPTMDHRGLVAIGGGFYSVGGMVADQEVTGEINPAAGAPDCNAIFSR